MKLPINEVKLNPKNPRFIKDDNFAKLVESLKTFPEMAEVREVVVNKDHVILGGNMRYRAMKEAGWSEVPVKVVDWDQSRQDEFMIKDNVAAGEWDWDLLANEWDQAQLDEWGLDMPTDFGEQEEVVEDEAPEVAEEVYSELGKIYQLGKHRVMCGDSTDFGAITDLLDGAEIDLLMIDPPYGISAEKMTLGNGKKEFHRGNWDSERPELDALMEFGKKKCVWGGNYFTDILPITNHWLCWHKDNDGLSFSEFELAWTDYGKNTRIKKHHWSGEEKAHPTQKPLPVMVWAIDMVNPNTVLDGFLGSGSTLIACEQTDRTCYGMELDPKYVDVIRKRWAKFVYPDTWEERWQELTPEAKE